MKKVNFQTIIKASSKKVWQVLWSDSTYRQWTNVFKEGSYAVSDWNQGSKIQFLSPDGDGMFSVIEECIPFERMTFRHLGEVKNFVELPDTKGSLEWNGSLEKYVLHDDGGNIRLEVSLESTSEFIGYFETVFPKALTIIKQLAENPLVIKIETAVAAPIEKIWDYWTSPVHIAKWNQASDDWHTTHAVNDLRVGGKFLSRMEAKDKSFGFDLEGIYNAIEPMKKINFALSDGRKVCVDFIQNANGYKVVEAFEAEEENTLELQQVGWQAILNNFKKHVEGN